MLFNNNLIPIPFNIRLGAPLGASSGVGIGTPEIGLFITTNTKTVAALISTTANFTVEQAVGIALALKL